MITEELQQEQRKPWFVVISIAGFAAVLFFSIYYEIQQSRLEGTIAELQAKKQELTTKESEGNAQTDRARALTAKDYLAELEKKQVVWSRIVEKIESVIPRRTGGVEPFVVFKSYSGSSEGRLAVNATTIASATDPFTDIALTIRAFSQDPTFKSVFVPSISRSLTPDGQTVLSFSMNFEYNPQNLLARPRTETPTPLPTTEVPAATSTTPTDPATTPGKTPTTTTTPAATVPVTPAR